MFVECDTGGVPLGAGLPVWPGGTGHQAETDHGQDHPEDAQGYQGKPLYPTQPQWYKTGLVVYIFTPVFAYSCIFVKCCALEKEICWFPDSWQKIWGGLLDIST